MFKKKSIIITLLIVILVGMLVLTGCGGDQKADKEKSGVIELKMGTKMPPESIEGQGFQKFADLVAEKTNGEVEVVVYPSEQLGSTETQVDNLALGTQDIYAEDLEYFHSYAPELVIEGLPYLFLDVDDFQDFVFGEYGDLINNKLEENGFVLLDPQRNFLRGPYRVMCSTEPIESIDDIQGLRMRSHDSSDYMKAYTTLGANPVVIAWSETYLALRQGTVKAVASPISLVYDMSFTEVAPYVARIDENIQSVAFVMNKEKFDSLTESQQIAVKEACVEAGKFATEITLAEVDKLIGKMEKEHGAVFVDIDTEPFRNQLKDFFLDMEEKGIFGEASIKDVVGK